MGDGNSITLSASLLNLIANSNILEEAVMELARNIMVAVVQALDDELLKRRPKGYICVGKRTKSISTRIGRYLPEPVSEGNGKGQTWNFPAGQGIGDPAEEKSVRRIIEALSVSGNAFTVADVLQEAGFSTISHTTIHKEVRRYGELEAQMLRRGVALMFGMGEVPDGEGKLRKVPILFIEADGVMVGCQRDPQKWRKQEIKLVTS